MSEKKKTDKKKVNPAKIKTYYTMSYPHAMVRKAKRCFKHVFRLVCRKNPLDYALGVAHVEAMKCIQAAEKRCATNSSFVNPAIEWEKQVPKLNQWAMGIVTGIH